MSDPLHKCRIAYGYDANATPLENRILFLGIVLRVKGWLLAQRLSKHLINTYDNEAEGATIVLSDRDTALLLKLSLG